MKRRFNIANRSLMLAVVFTLGSCNNFLDEAPDNRVELDDLDKAAQLLTNAYSVASVAFTDWMSDDSDLIQGTVKRPEHEVFFWEDIEQGPDYQDTPEFYWYETYAAIAHANEVLNVLEELPAETEEDVLRKNAIEAEARLSRAYHHFMLVNVFGRQFDLQGSGGDPGVPYITEPETSFLVGYKRNSVKNVYDNIEEDLSIGLELINDNFFLNSGKYHFNRNAALAFASRFYLYRGDFVRCEAYSSQLLGNNPENFVRDFNSDEYQLAKSSITGYPSLYSSADDPANLLLVRKISLIHIPSLGYGPTTTFYRSLFADLNPFFQTTDERENPAFVKGINGVFPVRYDNLFERTSLNSNVGLPYHIEVAFRGEEVLLNRVEANIIRNNLDEAVADLQILVERRYSGGPVNLSVPFLRSWFGADDDPTFTDQLILFNFLLFERRKEFISQGMRWFDLKRLEIQLIRESGMSLDIDDPRRVIQIPKSAIEVGGLEPNPR